MENPGVVASVQRAHLRRGGQEIQVSVSASLIELDGRLVFQDIVRDETERIRMEQQLRRTNDALQKEIAQREKTELALVSAGEYLRKLLESSEVDRKVLAYEIHDTAIQSLFAAQMHLESAEEKDEAQRAECYQNSRHLLQRCMAELRAVMSGLRPPILDDGDLSAIVGHLVEEHDDCGGPRVAMETDLKGEDIPEFAKATLFRIVQECLANVRKHSQSDSVKLRIVQTDHKIKLTVEDSGVGFEIASVRETSFGLRGIRERARAVNGIAEVISAPNKGTVVRVDLPTTAPPLLDLAPTSFQQPIVG